MLFWWPCSTSFAGAEDVDSLRHGHFFFLSFDTTLMDKLMIAERAKWTRDLCYWHGI